MNNFCCRRGDNGAFAEDMTSELNCSGKKMTKFFRKENVLGRRYNLHKGGNQHGRAGW